MTKKHDFLDDLPEGVDRKKVEMQLGLLVTAFLGAAEESIMEEKAAANKADTEPSHKKPTTDPQE